MRNRLVIKGAQQHGLRDVFVELPRDALAVFTGVPESGNSILTFGAVSTEEWRRHIESLSAYVRHFRGQLAKPDADAVKGLLPAVANARKTSSRNPRPTVGTLTEVHGHLRLPCAGTGRPYCPECGVPVSRRTPQRAVDLLLDEDDVRFQVPAPVVHDRKGEHTEVFRQLSADGSGRVRVDGTVRSPAPPPAPDERGKHSIDAVLDRPAVKPGVRQRLTESMPNGAERRPRLAPRNRFGRDRSRLAPKEGVIAHVERRSAEGVKSGERSTGSPDLCARCPAPPAWEAGSPRLSWRSRSAAAPQHACRRTPAPPTSNSPTQTSGTSPRSCRTALPAAAARPP